MEPSATTLYTCFMEGVSVKTEAVDKSVTRGSGPKLMRVDGHSYLLPPATCVLTA